MKRIAVSVLTITIVAIVGFAVTRAFFSDTERSSGNTITAGTIDISVDDENPWIASEKDEIKEMKPSYVRWTKHVVKNVGTNPLKLWKHIKDVETNNNGWSEPECWDQGGTWVAPDGCTTPNTKHNNIDEFIEYDMYIDGTVDGSPENNWLGGSNSGGTVVIDEDDGITVADIESVFVFLGELAPNNGQQGGPDEVVVWQSYHMRDDTGNWAQTDTLSYTIEFYAEQVNGNGPISGGPGPQTLLLENKNPSTWNPIIGDGTWGVLKWVGDGNTFDFLSTLEAHGLAPSTSYSLVYAPDPWPQGPLPESPSTVLGSASSNGSGNLTIAANPNLGYDIPHPSDTNSPTGGKIWLVLDADHDGTKMTAWNPSSYLFEYNLIKYNDTDN